MVLLRFLLILFNVVVVTFLVYRLIQVMRFPLPPLRKALVVAGGVFLLIAPFGIFFGIFRPSAQYFMLYPVAVAFYILLIRSV